MKRKTQKKRRFQIISLVLLSLLMVMFLMPNSAEAAVCERGFMSCLSDAMAAGLASGSLSVLSLFSTSCAMGYDWCLKYYKK